ncbi:GDSL esterase/lipase [Sesamum angolense]|uniref:GDSL esterase/lipase n=1 Tax=Sesamum angolense TaxID=2727404 RepID=A0AAE1W7L1_9LAMI|nr:GDSL esterase/lipase [Sesamum angolense]
MRRVIEAIAVGLLLVAAYLVFADRGQQTGVAYFQSRSGCRFSAIYNFGDSNSDSGSVSATFGRLRPPYGQTFFGKPSGRYSDGRLIIDFIGHQSFIQYDDIYERLLILFAHGANFAASGSTIQHLDAKLCSAGFNPLSLDVQVLQFEQLKARSVESYIEAKSYGSKISLPKPESFSRALFTMDSGQNDLHAGLTSMTEEQVKASIPGIIDQFSVALEQLYKLGARAFWIHNTGPIGCLPFFVVKRPPEPNNTDPSGCIMSYNEVAQEFNKQLKEKIFKLQTQLQDALLIYVDIYSVKYSLISHGKDRGFHDPLGYGCGRMGVVDCGEKAMVNGTQHYDAACSNPSEYISWDAIHYTEAANKWVAGRILDGSSSEPQVPIAEACYRPS